MSDSRRAVILEGILDSEDERNESYTIGGVHLNAILYELIYSTQHIPPSTIIAARRPRLRLTIEIVGQERIDGEHVTV